MHLRISRESLLDYMFAVWLKRFGSTKNMEACEKGLGLVPTLMLHFYCQGLELVSVALAACGLTQY